MKYKLLGNSGLRVAELALGTMTFGTEWGFGADRETAGRVFDAYAAAGGNFIDTANRYTNGTSEKWVGELVRADRDHFVIATKYTLSTRGDDPNAGGNNRKNLVQSLEASLRRLQTDRVDVYWVHIWDHLTPIHEVMRALDDQVRAGKILYAGISDAPAWVVARANTLAEERGWTPFAAVQSQYSLVERGAERELLPMSRSLDLAFTAWGALGGGVLSGKYNQDSSVAGRLAEGSGVRPLNQAHVATARAVSAVAEEIGVTASQLALGWLRSRSPLMIPILGASKVGQLEDNLGCLDFTITPAQLDRLDQTSAIELGFPYDFAKDGQKMFLGEVSGRVENHRQISW